MKMKRIQIPFEIKAAEGGKIEGYGSVFGNVDAYGDVIEKGAFAKSLADHSEKGTAPAMLWQHNPDWPIGKWTEFSEDDHGLKVRGVLADTQQARDVGALVRMGAITGASIGFMTKSEAMDRESGIRALKEVDLWEVSLVTFPANESARIAAKSAEIDGMEIREIERLLRDAGLSQRESKSVISRLMALGSARDAQAHRDAAELLAKLDRLKAALTR